jgi:hypothetical protein
MIITPKEWNLKQTKLRKLLADKNKFSEAIQLCLELHSIVHQEDVSGCSYKTNEDILWEDLSDAAFRFIPGNRNISIAWNLWHITRIEDITANILIADTSQVFNKNRMNKMQCTVTDTGNAMSPEEIRDFSLSIKMNELGNYRKEVGKKTQKIIKALKQDDIKRKFGKEQVERILSEGGLLNAKDSIWLLDFWGRKTVAGILLMPVTRHQNGHLNDSLRIKERYFKALKKQNAIPTHYISPS